MITFHKALHARGRSPEVVAKRNIKAEKTVGT
jgi:hypothetical protein